MTHQTLTIVSDFDKIEDAKRIHRLMKSNNLDEAYEQETGSLFSRKKLESKTVLAEKRSGQKGLFIYTNYKFEEL